MSIRFKFVFIFLIALFFLSCSDDFDEKVEFKIKNTVVYYDKFIILDKSFYDVYDDTHIILKDSFNHKLLLNSEHYRIDKKDSSIRIYKDVVRYPFLLSVYDTVENHQAGKPSDWAWLIFAIIIILLGLGLYFGINVLSSFFSFVGNWWEHGIIKAWWEARFHNLGLSFSDLWNLYHKDTDIKLIIDTMKVAHNSGVNLDVDELREIYLSGVDLRKIVDTFILSQNAELTLSLKDLQKHQLAGGNSEKVVTSLIMAKRSDQETTNEEIKLNLDFSTATSIDLAGEDVVIEVQNSTNYKVEKTGEVKGISKNGIEIILEAKVTMLTKINAVLSQAGKETVLARINRQIISEIGNKEHVEIIKNPNLITQAVSEYLNTFDDAAVNVISIDISDIKIGNNLFAELMEEQAKADKSRREANEQEMKTKEQEMKARLQEMRAKVEDANSKLIEAEIDVRKAIAKAFIDGNLDITTFNKIENIKADTLMRKNISSIQIPELMPPNEEENTNTND